MAPLPIAGAPTPPAPAAADAPSSRPTRRPPRCRRGPLLRAGRRRLPGPARPATRRRLPFRLRPSVWVPAPVATAPLGSPAWAPRPPPWRRPPRSSPSTTWSSRPSGCTRRPCPPAGRALSATDCADRSRPSRGRRRRSCRPTSTLDGPGVGDQLRHRARGGRGGDGHGGPGRPGRGGPTASRAGAGRSQPAPSVADRPGRRRRPRTWRRCRWRSGHRYPLTVAVSLAPGPGRSRPGPPSNSSSRSTALSPDVAGSGRRLVRPGG